MAEVRFAIASFLMLLVAHPIGRERMPSGAEWVKLAIYGLLNITIYLGCYVVAMQTLTAGVGAMSVAANPVFISFLSVFFLHKKLTVPIILSLVVCVLGILCVAWPLLKEATVSVKGLLLLFFSLLAYSSAAIFFAARPIKNMSLFAINGWQTLIGGGLLLPFALYYYNGPDNHYNKGFWSAVLWLAIPISIVAVQIWFWLLRINAVKASLWLFLCPIFGFAIASWIMHDSISLYTIVGVALVLAGLMLSQKERLFK